MRFLLPVCLLSLLVLVACERVEERMPITQSREISESARPANVDVPSSTRFYDDKEESQTKEHPLLWITPAGWTEGKASQMRLIDFRFGPAGEGECYLTAMPGDAGGISANLNRWRGQLGQPALSEAEIAALPKKKLMGAEAIFISVEGDFKGMGDAADAKTGYRLLGALLPNPELTMFVKMTGPKALVDQNVAAFDAFCASVQFRAKAQGVPSH